jgi:uncharacterized protein with NRDE domain
MCLAILALNVLDQWPVVVVANRDEYHNRPTAGMQPWIQMPHILAGCDLQAGGTWLGIGTDGRIALLTNVRDPSRLKHNAPTRGHLVSAFLSGNLGAQAYLNQLAVESMKYNGFNLVLTDKHTQRNAQWWHASNAQPRFVQPILSGMHGISNASLDTPWPKTVTTTQAVQAHLSVHDTPQPSALSQIMRNVDLVEDTLLPSTGIGIERERLLAPPFIVSPQYGTRCTTLVLQHRSGACWVQEDSFNSAGEPTARVRWQHFPHGSWQSTLNGPEALT